MNPITTRSLCSLLLALSLALSAIATGWAEGFSAYEARLTPMVICAGGEGQKTIFLSRDGTPVELPDCCDMLCYDCLQTGLHTSPAAPFAAKPPTLAKRVDPIVQNTPHHPEAIVRARSRAPPALSAIA